MPSGWPAVDYREWSATCDTLHAHTQLLGKLAAALSPPEPHFQHLALRLSARGWETLPLRASDGSGAFSVALDLHAHQTVIEHSDGRAQRLPLTPHRPVGEVTAEALQAVRQLAGPVEIDLTPQEVPWSVSLDEDREHAHYDPAEVDSYMAAATRAALVLAEFRAGYGGLCTPVNAWWGSFDVAVSLFSGPSRSEECELAVGWWPGDGRYPRSAFYAYARPAPDRFADGSLSPADARWEADLGEYILDWEDVRSRSDPHGAALQFAHSALQRARELGNWDSAQLAG